jgi:hypothetical protein
MRCVKVYSLLRICCYFYTLSEIYTSHQYKTYLRIYVHDIEFVMFDIVHNINDDPWEGHTEDLFESTGYSFRNIAYSLHGTLSDIFWMEC